MLIPPGNDRTPLVFRGPRGETLVGNLGMPVTLLATRIAGSEMGGCRGRSPLSFITIILSNLFSVDLTITFTKQCK